MADTAEAPVEKAEAPKDDLVKNLKSEMERKFSNIEKSNQALMAQLQSISTLNQKPKDEVPKAKLKDVWYEDPDKAADAVVNEATSRMRQELNIERQEQQKKQTVIQSLYKEYPELQDFDNPLTIKAVENFDKLPDDEKMHPMAYRLAVKEAAEDLDIKPKAKRKVKEDRDDFSLSGSDREGRQGTRRSSRLDEKTEEFGKLVGLDMDDEKVVERVKGYAQKRNFNRWE